MKNIIRSLLLMVSFTLTLGIIYPFITYTLGQFFFKNRADGSLIQRNGKVIGSALIGQPFLSDIYFHPRPSACNYDGMNSSSSNYSISSEKFRQETQKNEQNYRKENNLQNAIALPIDAITESSSGLDPHISKKNAYLQAKRISEKRKVPIQTILDLIDLYIEKPSFHLLGNERVNVLLLNLALDDIKK